MSYELKKPYTEKERIAFVINYNHNQGLQIEETDEALYALEVDEIMVDGKPQVDPEYEAKQAQIEAERIARLSLTKREVFLGLYQALGVTPDQIKAQITDPAALIEFEYANDYYRGNPLIDVVGMALGITSEQLDKFFDTKDYTVLLPVIETDADIDTDEETEDVV